VIGGSATAGSGPTLNVGGQPCIEATLTFDPYAVIREVESAYSRRAA